MVSGLILPLYYAMTGLNTDVLELHCGRLLFVVFLWWFGKLVGVMVPSMYFEIPLLDAVSLSLFMNSKGIVESSPSSSPTRRSPVRGLDLRKEGSIKFNH
jgi:Kef-type K+ transport system membrane component KefB